MSVKSKIRKGFLSFLTAATIAFAIYLVVDVVMHPGTKEEPRNIRWVLLAFCYCSTCVYLLFLVPTYVPRYLDDAPPPKKIPDERERQRALAAADVETSTEQLSSPSEPRTPTETKDQEEDALISENCSGSALDEARSTDGAAAALGSVEELASFSSQDTLSRDRRSRFKKGQTWPRSRNNGWNDIADVSALEEGLVGPEHMKIDNFLNRIDEEKKRANEQRRTDKSRSRNSSASRDSTTSTTDSSSYPIADESNPRRNRPPPPPKLNPDEEVSLVPWGATGARPKTTRRGRKHH
ncbi:uncharacterized protein LOC108665357 [Hyalella azteca]|uniref:Uncharacterized protein LOC108665357 n=1 Tax=Hyalella azteca TaxID=294128 RepID=A0A8B7N179_HYAAZ|nr:uncharacterized protein LOC108665357 [Hyalella azteca]XP_018007593.1 uncharacterized protein LOC108665357 [Hyalella azteca]